MLMHTGTSRNKILAADTHGDMAVAFGDNGNDKYGVAAASPMLWIAIGPSGICNRDARIGSIERSRYRMIAYECLKFHPSDVYQVMAEVWSTTA
jgi:hypothetical protein